MGASISWRLSLCVELLIWPTGVWYLGFYETILSSRKEIKRRRKDVGTEKKEEKKKKTNILYAAHENSNLTGRNKKAFSFREGRLHMMATATCPYVLYPNKTTEILVKVPGGHWYLPPPPTHFTILLLKLTLTNWKQSCFHQHPVRVIQYCMYGNYNLINGNILGSILSPDGDTVFNACILLALAHLCITVSFSFMFNDG